MQLKRYISQEGLPSRTGTSPVDFADFGKQGAAIDRMGDQMRATGMHLFQAGAPERDKLRQQEAHRLKVEEDLQVQEALTTFKTLSSGAIQKRIESYSPGASDEDIDVTKFAMNTIGEVKSLMELEAFDNMTPVAKMRFKHDAFAHIDSLIPGLNKARGEMLVQRNEARLGQSKVTHEQRANLTDDPLEVMKAMDGYSEDLKRSVANGTLAPDKAVEREEKFNRGLAESWFNGKIGTDPEGLFRSLQAPLPEEAYMFSLLGGKDKTGFTQEHEKRVLDGIERSRKDDERKLEEKQTQIENTFWDSFYAGTFAQTKQLFAQHQPELRKLKPDRYKSIAKEIQEAKDVGGKGNEELMNRWKTEIFHNADALSSDEIFKMPGLNWKQRQALYEAKRTQTQFEHARSTDPKHFSNNPNYKFYSGELQEQLGVIKLSPFTDAASRQLLSQAEIAFRTEYERLYEEKKGRVSQEEAKVLMQGIVTTARQNLGFKARVTGELPRFTDAAMLQAAKDAGKLTEKEYAEEYRKLKAWRALEEEKAQPKEFKKHGKD